jgi:hypothetical protein
MIRKTMTIYKLAVDDTPVTEDFAKKNPEIVQKEEVEMYPLGKWFEMNDEILDLLEDGDEAVVATPYYRPEKSCVKYNKEEEDFYLEDSSIRYIQPGEIEAIAIIERKD